MCGLAFMGIDLISKSFTMGFRMTAFEMPTFFGLLYITNIIIPIYQYNKNYLKTPQNMLRRFGDKHLKKKPNE